MAMVGVRLTTALLGMVVAGCVSFGYGSQPGQTSRTVKDGTWGGQHLSMRVSPASSELEFDCGTGSVEGRIPLDRENAFSVSGTLTREGGPTRLGGTSGQPMRLTGTVDGDTMKVRIVLTDSDADEGTFTLALGAEARLVKCR